MDLANDDTEEDFDALNAFLDEGKVEGTQSGLDLDTLNDRELNAGEKDANAVDYEDIDLSDDENQAEDKAGGIAAPQTQTEAPAANNDVSMGGNDNDNSFDYLFEDDGTDPFGEKNDDLFNEEEEQTAPLDESEEKQETRESQDEHTSAVAEAAISEPEKALENLLEKETEKSPQEAIEEEPVLSSADSKAPPGPPGELTQKDRELWEEQMKLFAYHQSTSQAREKGEAIPPPPETPWELFNTIFPNYERGKPPAWTRLIPPRPARFATKKPLKPPKAVRPTKVNLEIGPDQERLFRLPGPASSTFAVQREEFAAKGITMTTQPVENQEEESEDEEMDVDKEEGLGIAGVTWQDLVTINQDWDIPSGSSSPLIQPETEDVYLGDDEQDVLAQPPHKKHKLSFTDIGAQHIMYDFKLPIEDPEKATAQLAKKVQLDLNDPYLLVDTSAPDTTRQRKRTHANAFQRDAIGGLSRAIKKRYNISNDEAYGLLKENHQNRVRSTVGSVEVEHALPAVKLQYPFYKTTYTSREARALHRQPLSEIAGVAKLYPLVWQKKRSNKEKTAQENFPTSGDLSQADNSSMLLLEYSEEYPLMLSGFGMGNRLINYYRRVDDQDGSYPVAKYGKTEPLAPQDKSPFSIFGNVEAGQTVPTIHNNMFRAPVFKHQEDLRDFMLISSKTIDDRKWYMKNVEGLHVVGQQLPFVDVPNPKSRKVTDASKKRLKMLTWRMFNKGKRVKNDEVVKHAPGQDVAAVRSKIREWMSWDKERGWQPFPGRDAEDEASIRAMVTPEDVCLLDSMKLGEQHLHDAGYNSDVKDSEDEEQDDQDDDDAKPETADLEQQLAPWNLTKNFLNATQGKAMLALHGEGDPTGRGEGLNMMKTSMKGGFKQIGESIEDRLDADRRKAMGGHSFNVAQQQKDYSDGIQKVWDAQNQSLSSTVVPDVEMGDPALAAENNVGAPANAPPAPSGASKAGGSSHAPSRVARTREDENTSIISRASMGPSKSLTITRSIPRDKYGNEEPEVTQTVLRDPQVIKMYKRRRDQMIMDRIVTSDIKMTGDPFFDRLQKMKAKREVKIMQAKFNRSAARKGKNATAARAEDNAAPAGASPPAAGSPAGAAAAGSPGAAAGATYSPPASAAAKTTGPKNKNKKETDRKCTLCGLKGHIRTKKKVCPMQNGEWGHPPVPPVGAGGGLDGGSSPGGAEGRVGGGGAKSTSGPAVSGF
ncbi:MAG: hypothetical protein M1831_006519 [Alyxoria varia]|nr:MAG: hypothetical protein M1831_006519 [Alyxoria varia]